MTPVTLLNLSSPHPHRSAKEPFSKSFQPVLSRLGNLKGAADKSLLAINGNNHESLSIENTAGFIELLTLNISIEPDLQSFVVFMLECAKHLHGNTFQASLASLELIKQLRSAGAGSGKLVTVSLHLANQRLQAHWNENSYFITSVDAPAPSVVEQLCAHLRKSTEAIEPEILIQRNEAMMRNLEEARERTERELAELQVKLLSRQAELQVSIRQAETDPLTGLLNRRAFDEKLGQAFRHTLRQKVEPLSLVILDLDFFKNINDQHGHQYGDEYLIKMAKSLQSVIREDVDFAFRFGGDEFAMMIFADNYTACEKARLVLDKMNGKVSIGISTIDRHTHNDLTLEQFIHQADSALYDAKHRGRGRTVVSQCGMGDSQTCGQNCPSREFHV